MTIIDANLLLLAYNADAPQQSMAAQWLRKILWMGKWRLKMKFRQYSICAME